MNIFLRKVRVALTPKDWLLKATLNNGAIVCGKNRKGYGGRGIYIFRDQAEPEFEHLEKFIESDDVFVDVGANTGIYTMKAAKKIRPDKGHVISVEPFPDVFAMLYHNVQVNGFTHVRLRNFCAAARTEATRLYLNFGKPNSFSILQRDKEAPFLSVLSVALDDLFAWEKLTRLNFLKIDAEGAEPEILLGGTKIIAASRPIIQMEITISDLPLKLDNYTGFQCPGGVNKMWIPNESPKLGVPKDLGWQKLN